VGQNLYIWINEVKYEQVNIKQNQNQQNTVYILLLCHMDSLHCVAMEIIIVYC